MADNVLYWNIGISSSENKKKLLKFIVENVKEIADYPEIFDSPNKTYILIQENESGKIHIIEPGTLLFVDKEGHFYTERTDKNEDYY